MKLVLVGYLNPEMLDAGRCTARANREVDARIIQHPLRVVRLEHGWRGSKQVE